MTTLADPITELDGVPFLDDGFAARRLLAAVAAARHVAGQRADLADEVSADQAELWLSPSRAVMLVDTDRPIPAVPLGAARKGQVKASLEYVAATIPDWKLLLDLPTRFALLYPPSGAISASSRAWPQHVLLSAEAFASPSELAEQIVHELAHQWIYLIQEIWALGQHTERRFTLPSGTSHRPPAEVLGAAHVAATLIRLYQATSNDAEERISALREYGAGCLALLEVPDLTDAGWAIAQRIKEAL
ncbi:aKG-HExxH-type peptide beta-hydroxylase [Nonomuraea sp. NPDC049400]|uniref:aKG-HExxH-type peptide beta-hydroxylase n=1 Tax=Nonomuraea sp. NPDC049400 TaxID=3364352 RepID=UPI0037AF147D